MLKTIFAASVAAVSLAVPAMAQVTSVSQLKDVQPTDWSYAAISNLVSRYGCVAGYPSGDFKPGQPASRAELAALVSACIDRISEFQNAQDAQLAAALKTQAAQWSGTQATVAGLVAERDAKNQGVGNYVGIGVLLNNVGTGEDPNDVISGATLQGRYAVKNFANANAVSVRPYINAVAGPNSQIGAAGGVTATYDFAIAKTAAGVSKANIYTGVGYQVPFSNGVEANAQNAVGLSDGQAVFVLGAEGRITNSLVGFANLLFPTNTSANGGSYSPVFSSGLGFKF
jgi:hypothetical protein